MLCNKSLYTIAKFNHLKDYYAVLNISKSCDQSAIKKAYYAIAKKCHPDLQKGKEEQFKEVNEAYEVLSDEATKKEYDQARTSGGSNFGTSHQHQNQRRDHHQQYQLYNSQKWSHSHQFEEAMRKAQQEFHKQQQQQYQQRRDSYQQQREEEERQRRRDEEYQEQFREYAKQFEFEKRRKHFYSQQEREAYEQYLRQREYEEFQKERYEEYKYKVQDISEGLENIQKNWSSIKQNVGQIWNVFKGKKQ